LGYQNIIFDSYAEFGGTEIEGWDEIAIVQDK